MNLQRTIHIYKSAISEDQDNMPGEVNAEKPWTLWNLNDKYTSMMKARILVNENYPDSLKMEGRDFQREAEEFREELIPFDAEKALTEIAERLSD
jgi:hypothetical protein